MLTVGRHSFWPFIEGVSERTYTDAELEAMKPENRPKITYEGREYDDYQATQQQRRIEREIRKEKRRHTAYKAAGLEEDAKNSKIRLGRLNTKYREFSKAAGLPEQRERMRVLYANNSPAAESDIGDALRRTAKGIAQGKKVVGFTGLPKEMQESFRSGLSGAAPKTKEVLRNIYRKTDYALVDGKRSYYSGGILKNIIHIGKNASSSTIAHELFHKLDEGHKISKTLTESLTRDYVALNVASGSDIKGYLLRAFPEIFSRTSRTGEPLMGEPYRGISDILNGLSGGKVYYGYGHSEKYWKQTGALEAEAWAQFGRIQFENDADVLKTLKKIFPNFAESAIMALKGLI